MRKANTTPVHLHGELPKREKAIHLRFRLTAQKMISRAALQNARATARIVRSNQISSSRTLSSTSRRWAEVTVAQPQDLVERSLKPGTEPDPQCEFRHFACQEKLGWPDVI